VATDLASAFSGDYGMSQATARKRRLHSSLANQLSAFSGQKRGQRNIQNINRAGVQNFGELKAQYGQRGLAGPNVQSGIQRSGLTQFAAGLSTQVGGAQSDLQDELNRIGLNEANETDQLDEFVKNLDLQKQQQVLQAAGQLKQYSSY